MGGLAREDFPAVRYGKKWLPSDVLGGGLTTSGNVYWVKKTTDSDYATFQAEHSFTYSNGTESLYNTIQAAVNAATDGGCETIIVQQGKWVEDVVIYNKNGLRLYGVGYGTGGTENGGTRIRPNDATTKYSFTSKIGTASNGAGFHVMSRNVEIAGFYFDGGGGCSGIYAGGGLNGGTGLPSTTANCSGLYIHNNMIRGGSEGQIGVYMNGVRFGAIIENNLFERWTGAGIEMDAGNASNEFCVIRYNTFLADNAAYGVNVYGEANSAIGCFINSNWFGDRVSHSFTMAVNNNTGSTGVLNVADNHFAVNHPMVLTTADWVSGNTYGFSGSATEDSNKAIQETAAGA